MAAPCTRSCPKGQAVQICAGTGPHLRRDWPTSAPGLAHICAGTGPRLRRDWPTSAPGLALDGPHALALRARVLAPLFDRSGEQTTVRRRRRIGTSCSTDSQASCSCRPPNPETPKQSPELSRSFADRLGLSLLFHALPSAGIARDTRSTPRRRTRLQRSAARNVPRRVASPCCMLHAVRVLSRRYMEAAPLGTSRSKELCLQATLPLGLLPPALRLMRALHVRRPHLPGTGPHPPRIEPHLHQDPATSEGFHARVSRAARHRSGPYGLCRAGPGSHRSARPPSLHDTRCLHARLARSASSSACGRADALVGRRTMRRWTSSSASSSTSSRSTCATPSARSRCLRVLPGTQWGRCLRVLPGTQWVARSPKRSSAPHRTPKAPERWTLDPRQIHVREIFWSRRRHGTLLRGLVHRCADVVSSSLTPCLPCVP